MSFKIDLPQKDIFMYWVQSPRYPQSPIGPWREATRFRLNQWWPSSFARPTWVNSFMIKHFPLVKLRLIMHFLLTYLSHSKCWSNALLTTYYTPMLFDLMQVDSVSYTTLLVFCGGRWSVYKPLNDTTHGHTNLPCDNLRAIFSASTMGGLEVHLSL